jgi:hypothetical protein
VDPQSYDDLGLLVWAIKSEHSFKELEPVLKHLLHPEARSLWIITIRQDPSSDWHDRISADRARALHAHLVKAAKA